MIFKRSHFVYSPRQRNGIVFFIGIVVSIRLVFEVFNQELPLEYHAQIYLRQFILSQRFDSINVADRLVDSYRWRLKPFNLNYLNDYRAYRLNLSVEQVDQFYKFRSEGGYCYDLNCFKKVLALNDSVIKSIAPYLIIPSEFPEKTISKTLVAYFDLNTADKEQLESIKYIGSFRAQKIIEYRTYLKGFSTLSQLEEIEQLDSMSIVNLNSRLKIDSIPARELLDINKARFRDLINLPYLDYETVKEILIFRQLNGGFKKIEELRKIPNLDSIRIKRITLYLQT